MPLEFVQEPFNVYTTSVESSYRSVFHIAIWKNCCFAVLSLIRLNSKFKIFSDDKPFQKLSQDLWLIASIVDGNLTLHTSGTKCPRRRLVIKSKPRAYCQRATSESVNKASRFPKEILLGISHFQSFFKPTLLLTTQNNVVKMTHFSFF